MGGKRAPPRRTSLAGSRRAAKPWAHAEAAPCRQPAQCCTHGQSQYFGGEHLQEEFQSAWPIGDTLSPSRGRLASGFGDLTPLPIPTSAGG